MWTDCLGSAVTLDSAAALPALNDFIEGFIASEARAVNILEAAESDHGPLVQACAAAVTSNTTQRPVEPAAIVCRSSAVAAASGMLRSGRERPWIVPS